MSSVLTRGRIRTWTVALRLLLLATAATIAYTLVVTLIGQLVVPRQANGSLVTDADGRVVGSALIGQSFTDAEGVALPEWFQSRPSAAGDGYDGGASSGSNLGPNNPDLLQAVRDREAAIIAADGDGPVPVDALTASASGLDPHISEAYALRQVARVAAARDLPETDVRALVERSVQAPDLGFLGQPMVNVLRLNLALEALARRG